MRMGEQRRGLTARATGVLALGAAAALAADPAVTCKTGKMIRAGTYELCVLKPTALALTEGAAAPDLSRCDAKVRQRVGQDRGQGRKSLPDVGRCFGDRRAAAKRRECDRRCPDAADHAHPVRR